MYRGCIHDVSWVRPTIHPKYIHDTLPTAQHSRCTHDTLSIHLGYNNAIHCPRYVPDTYAPLYRLWRRQMWWQCRFSAAFHQGPICGGQCQAHPQCSFAFGVDFGPRYVSRPVSRFYCGMYRGMYPCIEVGGRDVSTMLVSRCIGGCIGVVGGAIHVSRLYRNVFRVRSLNTCLNTSRYITIHVSESKLSLIRGQTVPHAPPPSQARSADAPAHTNAPLALRHATESRDSEADKQNERNMRGNYMC